MLEYTYNFYTSMLNFTKCNLPIRLSEKDGGIWELYGISKVTLDRSMFTGS